MNDQLIIWLSNPHRNYDEGLILYKKAGLKHNAIEGGRFGEDFLLNVLEHLFCKQTRLLDPPVKRGALKIEEEKQAPEIEKDDKVVAAAEESDDLLNSAEKAETAKLTREMALDHAAMKHEAKTPEERKKIAGKIIKTEQAREQIWAKGRNKEKG